MTCPKHQIRGLVVLRIAGHVGIVSAGATRVHFNLPIRRKRRAGGRRVVTASDARRDVGSEGEMWGTPRKRALLCTRTRTHTRTRTCAHAHIHAHAHTHMHIYIYYIYRAGMCGGGIDICVAYPAHGGIKGD